MATRFDRHRKKSLAALVVASVVLVDVVAGILLIPPPEDGFRRPDPVYHHGLHPLRSESDRWGFEVYPFFTNSLGLRDASPRDVPLAASPHRLLLIGDSFIEGVGVPWEESVAGVLQHRLEPKGIEVLNAGVNTYSPKLYYLKTRHLLEAVGLEIDELFVFIDISDIQNEILYRRFEPSDGLAEARLYRLKRLLRLRSYLFYSLDLILAREWRGIFGEEFFPEQFAGLTNKEARIIRNTINYAFLASWTYNPKRYELFGAEGLRLAARNMDRLVELSRDHDIALHLVVYPWPPQIEVGDPDNLQVRFWREFAAKRELPFHDLFPAFIDGTPADEVEARYFVAGDIHWNAAGNRRVAETLLRRIGR